MKLERLFFTLFDMILKEAPPRGERGYFTTVDPDPRAVTRTEWEVSVFPLKVKGLVKHLDVDLPEVLESINEFLSSTKIVHSGRVDLDELILDRVVKEESKIIETAPGIEELTHDSIHYCPGKSYG